MAPPLFAVWNQYITWPDDYLPIIPYAFGTAFVHWLIKDALVTPLAKKYLVEDQLAKEVAAAKRAAAAANGAGNGVQPNATVAEQRKGKAEKAAAEKEAADKAAAEAKKKASEDDDGPRYLEEKFGMAVWNFVCHGFLWLYGWYAIRDEPWVSDPRLWFEGWPASQTMSPRMFTLYYLFTGYYVYAFFDLFRQLRQKDFAQMVVHHAVSCFLLLFAFSYGFHRVGAVLMLYHEASDPFMEAAKVAVYTGYQRVADLLFVAFAAVFIVTRDIQYPINVIYPAWKYAPTTYPDGTPDPGILPVIIFALLTLLALHIFWSAIIVSIAIKFIREGQVKGDVRDQHFDEAEMERVEHAAE
ncbi:TLC domain-containing protein [Hyaloraphidium curvatum]|nr:TLC domain-containing protein [Hyaloraphidium curvatum]